MSLRSTILKQSHPRLWLGAARDMMQRAQSYYGLMNALLLLVTVYTVREVTIQKYIPGMTFPLFLVVIMVVMLIVVLLDYKLIYPSQIAFHQHEAYKHRSLVRKDFEAANQRQEEMQKQIQSMAETLERVEKKLDIKEGLNGER